MNGNILVTLCLAMGSLAGCATTTHFTSIPTSNEDFSQPVATIREKYGDVVLYEPKEMSWRDIFNPPTRPPGPSISELEGKWGGPERTKVEWGDWTFETISVWVLGAITGYWLPSAITTVVFSPPWSTYYWDKGTTHIEAKVSHFMFHGYEGRLGLWQWTEQAHDTAIQSATSQPGKSPEY